MIKRTEIKCIFWLSITLNKYHKRLILKRHSIRSIYIQFIEIFYEIIHLLEFIDSYSIPSPDDSLWQIIIIINNKVHLKKLLITSYTYWKLLWKWNFLEELTSIGPMTLPRELMDDTPDVEKSNDKFRWQLMHYHSFLNDPSLDHISTHVS